MLSVDRAISDKDPDGLASQYAAFDGYAPNLKAFHSVNTASQIVGEDNNPIGSFVVAGIKASLITEGMEEI